MSAVASSDFTGTEDREPRLEIFRDAKGLGWRQRMLLLPIRLVGGRYPGPQQVLLYRAALLGRRFVRALRAAMRQSDHWNKEELELFAAFTANQLRCAY